MTVVSTFARGFRRIVRSARRAPGHYLLATGILGLGMGASVSIFSAVNAVLVAPLPFPDGDRLDRFQVDPRRRDPVEPLHERATAIASGEIERRAFLDVELRRASEVAELLSALGHAEEPRVALGG